MILNGDYYDCFAHAVWDDARPYEEQEGCLIFPLKAECLPGMVELLDGLNYEMLYLCFRQVKDSGHGRWYQPHLYLLYKNGNTQLLSCNDCLLSDEEYDTFGLVEGDACQATYLKYA